MSEDHDSADPTDNVVDLFPRAPNRRRSVDEAAAEVREAIKRHPLNIRATEDVEGIINISRGERNMIYLSMVASIGAQFVLENREMFPVNLVRFAEDHRRVWEEQ